MPSNRNLSHLNEWGWSYHWLSVLETYEAQRELPETTIAARVVGEHRDSFEVLMPHGRVRADAKGRLRKKGQTWPAVGDWVLIDARDANQPLIEDVLERKTILKRMAAGESGDVQVLATNIDVVFVATSLNQDFNPRKIERFIVAARESGARVVLLLTKSDLGEISADDARDEMHQRLGDFLIISTSAKDGVGIDRVRAEVPHGTTAVFLGASGVGKSSLVNSLFGADVQSVSGIRTDDDKGRHTTTGRHSHVIPGAGAVIDTPGIRELQLTDLTTSLEEEFTEIEEIALRCKFTNCRHEGEKGCAIQTALDTGQLDADRLFSYRKLKAEAESKRKRTRR